MKVIEYLKRKITKIKGFGLKKPIIKKVLKITLNIVFTVFFLFLGLIVLLSIQSKATGDVPKLGKYQLYAVVGGSMEPSIHKGSIVIITHPETQSLKVNDVITFLSPSDKTTVVTHRIVKINTDNEITFTTRGDANDSDDIEPLPANYILGKVNMTIPLIGSLISFTKTKAGLIAFIIVPGVLIIIFEMLDLRKTFIQIRKQKEALMLAKLKESLNQTSSQGGNTVT